MFPTSLEIKLMVIYFINLVATARFTSGHDAMIYLLAFTNFM